MPVSCQICGQEFRNLITSTHLKRHNMLTAEYVELYGRDALSSPEYRQDRSSRCTGENNPHYGKTHSPEIKAKISQLRKGKPNLKLRKPKSEDHVAAIRRAVIQREEKYKSGELIRAVHSKTPETRQVLSEKQIAYAKANPTEMQLRAKKAVATKTENDYDFAFFRGRKHTSDTREKLRILLQEHQQKRTKKSHEAIRHNANLANVEIISALTDTTVDIKCLTCSNEFTFTKQYFFNHKFFIELCPFCHPRNAKTSAVEEEVSIFLNSLNVPHERNNRTVLQGKELDIYVPSHNLAIELNGIYWHSQSVLESNNQSKFKDLEKLEACSKRNIRLLTIYDSEWRSCPEIIKSIVTNALGLSVTKIHARKCEIREIMWKEAKVFLDSNHRQKSGRAAKVRLGLFYENELVSVMTFSSGSAAKKQFGWELDRFCSKINCSVTGGASKLFKYFVNHFAPDRVTSFSDRRYSIGNLYSKLGFEHESDTTPNYWYFYKNSYTLIHRYNLRKRPCDDPQLTEYQNRLAQGYNRIWDCGHSKWIWKKPA